MISRVWRRCGATLTVASALCLSLAACGSSDGANDSADDDASLTAGAITAEDAQISVLLQATAASARWESQDRPRLQEALTNYAPNAEVDFVNAEGDSARQLAQAEAAIVNGAEVLLVAPVDGTAAGEIARRAQQAEVKVIAYDALILDAPVDAYVSFDNETVGALMGQWVAENTQDGDTIGMIGGSPQDNNATLFEKGALDVLQPLYDSGQRQLGYRTMTPDWQLENAQREAEQMLSQLNNNVDAVVVGNDNLATGVIAALRAQGLAGEVPVTGQDATVVGLQQILLGEQGMTVWKPINQEADAAAQLAAHFVEGTTPPDELVNGTINNGAVDIPSALLEPVSVTAENMLDTVVEAGVYTTEELCDGLSTPCPLG